MNRDPLANCIDVVHDNWACLVAVKIKPDILNFLLTRDESLVPCNYQITSMIVLTVFYFSDLG